LIYFVQVGDTGPIKIGRTENLRRRFANLQIGNPAKLRVIGVIPEEIELHCEFADIALRGEWFKADQRLLEFIERYACLEDEWRGWSDTKRAAQRLRATKKKEKIIISEEEA